VIEADTDRGQLLHSCLCRCCVLETPKAREAVPEGKRKGKRKREEGSAAEGDKTRDGGLQLSLRPSVVSGKGGGAAQKGVTFKDLKKGAQVKPWPHSPFLLRCWQGVFSLPRHLSSACTIALLSFLTLYDAMFKGREGGGQVHRRGFKF